MGLLRVLCILMIVSGIAGVAVGHQSAVAGWWLIIVFGAALLLTFAWLAPQPVQRP
jgi:uncharacterized membrane protein HdeD (DUF308 family)